MQTFEVDGPVQVAVESSAGRVRVDATGASGAQVDVRPQGNDEASRTAAEQTRVELRDGRLTVEVPKRDGWLFGREPRVLVEVTVPAGSGLTFTTASADVEVSGEPAEVRGRTASGDVRVADATTVRIETASGDVKVGTVRGAAGLKTASGNIDLASAAGQVDAAVVSGDLRVGSIEGAATLRAVSGDIELGAVAEGQVEVRSVSGDVTVGVRRGSRVHVDVTTVSGDLKSDLDLTDAPGGAGDEGPLVDLRGRTVSGDLRVRRAG